MPIIRFLTLSALAALALPLCAFSQTPSTAAPTVSTPPAAGAPAETYVPPMTPPQVTAMTALGIPLAPDKGPWVLGDVRFQGNVTVSEYALASKVRAKRGSLYMPEDVAGDVNTLKATGSFSEVTYAVYAIANQPAPEGYQTIAVSTHMVRLVFTVVEKSGGTPVVTQPAKELKPEDRVPPAAVSGVVMTPTAYRGLGRLNEPGLGLDINAVYYIGRLYGKNNLDYTIDKTNYIDRIGVWLLGADGKMQLQSEGDWRPAVAAGVQGIFQFRDSPQPTLATPSATVKVSQKTTRALAAGYVVASKKVFGIRASAGFMQGNAGDITGALTEFLSPQALLFNGHPGQTARSNSVPFASLMILPKPAYPLAVEVMKPNGMALQPILINFKLGYFLKLNFDVAYLKFNGGYDVLGMFQFRTNYFPRK